MYHVSLPKQQDGSSDGTSSLGKQSSRNARKDKHQRGGDYDLAGLLKKLANIGVDDLRRQLKNPLKDSQVNEAQAWSGSGLGCVVGLAVSGVLFSLVLSFFSRNEDSTVSHDC